MNFNFPFTLAPKVGLHIIHNVHKYIDSAEKKLFISVCAIMIQIHVHRCP